MPDSSIRQRLASLPNLSEPALCKLWRQLFKKEPPREIRKDLMVRMVAHRLQEDEFGGLKEISLSPAPTARIHVRSRPKNSGLIPATHQARNPLGPSVETASTRCRSRRRR